MNYTSIKEKKRTSRQNSSGRGAKSRPPSSKAGLRQQIASRKQGWCPRGLGPPRPGPPSCLTSRVTIRARGGDYSCRNSQPDSSPGKGVSGLGSQPGSCQELSLRWEGETKLARVPLHEPLAASTLFPSSPGLRCCLEALPWGQGCGCPP